MFSVTNCVITLNVTIPISYNDYTKRGIHEIGENLGFFVIVLLMSKNLIYLFVVLVVTRKLVNWSIKVQLFCCNRLF